MDVEERDDVAFLERVAFDIRDGTAHLLDHANGDVTRNERIGHARQFAVM
jgi:hypothetical protein